MPPCLSHDATGCCSRTSGKAGWGARSRKTCFHHAPRPCDWGSRSETPPVQSFFMNNLNSTHCAFPLLSLTLVLAASAPASASDFATSVLSYVAGSNAANGYTNPLVALGPPERFTGEGIVNQCVPSAVTSIAPPSAASALTDPLGYAPSVKKEFPKTMKSMPKGFPGWSRSGGLNARVSDPPLPIETISLLRKQG